MRRVVVGGWLVVCGLWLVVCGLWLVVGHSVQAQTLKWSLGADSTRWVSLNVLAQPWVRYDQSNPGTLINDEPFESTFDIGIRRARVTMQAQLTDRAFLFVQYGLNNLNSMVSTGGNRKWQAFFHDLFGEYRLTEHNELKLGAGLTITNGLSRFQQPSVTTIMTTDVPVFAQATVDQIDEFSRKLSVTARGQVGPIDYRIALSDPFPITSTGSTAPAIGSDAQFTTYGHTLQQQGYVIWQFLEHEPHTTPYMTGTYLGTKKVFNIGAGAIYQPRATWRTDGADTVFDDLLLLSVESFYDAPIGNDGLALSAYAGAFLYDYGKNYLRYNGLMNPANGINTSVNPTPLNNVGPVYGNAYPMFGTGSALYAQAGIYLPSVIGTAGLMPYASVFSAAWDKLGTRMNVFNVGASLLMDGHHSKVSVDLQNRPTYGTDQDGRIVEGVRRTQVVVQYQLFL